MKVKIGIIGLGYWGPNLLRNFFELENCEVVYCCDTDKKIASRISKQFPSIIYLQDSDVLFSDKTIDAVIIATPSNTHAKLTKKALKARKHVLVEKPFTLSSKDAKQLMQLSKKVKKIIMVGHTYEYNSAILKLRDYIKSGELGDVRYIYGSRVNLGKVREETNALWNLAPHDISILRFILNKSPIAVSAFGRAFLQKKHEDVVFINLQFPNNIIAHIHVSWLDPQKERKMTIIGSKKMVLFDDMDIEAPLHIYDKGFLKAKRDVHKKKFGEFHLLPRFGEIKLPFINRLEPLKEECNHFIECINNNANPRSNADSGLAVVKTLEAAQKSLDSGGSWTKL